MDYSTAVVAGIGCAICYGISSILQKISADKEATASSLNVGLFLKLLKDSPYLIGLAIDLGGWALNLIAVHSLPLFFVQALVASSIIVAALIEQILTRRLFTGKVYIAIMGVLVGLILLGLGADTEKAYQPHFAVRLAIVLAPILIALIAALSVSSKGRSSYLNLSILSGLAFGGTSIIGRTLTYNHRLTYYLTCPLSWALVAYGILGIYLFTIALQRSEATKVLATVIASETVVPVLVGIILFSDKAKTGRWPDVVIGIVLVIAGCIFTSLSGAGVAEHR